MPQFVPVHPNATKGHTWERFLCGLQIEENEMDGKPMYQVAPPPISFKEHVLREYMDHIIKTPNLLVYCQHKEYNNVTNGVELLWFAKIRKILGYRALMSWIGPTNGDREHDFWINLGSDVIRGIGAIDEEKQFVIPPKFLGERWSEPERFVAQIAASVIDVSKACTISETFSEYRNKILFESCKFRAGAPFRFRILFQVGQRVELLDNRMPERIRPARIKSICGRRVWVQVLKSDCDAPGEDDSQFGSEAQFWVDQSSPLLFPVGWACLNKYRLDAKTDYKRHAQKIAEDIMSNIEPQYDLNDVRAEQIIEWKQISNDGPKWEVGMKFELFDPFTSSSRDFIVASVVEILQDGYLRVGIDGTEVECLPVHCTSHFLFPAGYAEKHDITLIPPEGWPEKESFKWSKYLKKTKAKAAPKDFFKKDPAEERMKKFAIGSKLEVADLCEFNVVCPGSVIGIKGRLILVHYDGWDSTYDTAFDVDSMDIFPIGWCELHGLELAPPESRNSTSEEPVSKKKRK